MLAQRRTDKVIGRIILETISIKTIKFINIKGVPIGTKWAIIFFLLFNHPKIIKDNHKTRAQGKVTNIWAVGVKIKGNKAKKLIKKMEMNKNRKII